MCLEGTLEVSRRSVLKVCPSGIGKKGVPSGGNNIDQGGKWGLFREL